MLENVKQQYIAMAWFENYTNLNSDKCNLILGNKPEQEWAQIEAHKTTLTTT